MNGDAHATRNEKSLTPVDEHVQCAAADAGGGPVSEADEAAVQSFIETLARIAHAVATRNAQKQQQEKIEQ